MKFGKEFRAQMVPEWQQAYMDYDHLKSILKDTMISRHTNSSSRDNSPKRKVSLYRAFSGLMTTPNRSKRGHEEEAHLFTPYDEAAAREPAFFATLDAELSKVASFYASKVDEVVDEADELSRQMDVLIALRVKVVNPMVSFSEYDTTEHIADDANTSSSKQQQELNKHMDAIQEIEMTTKGLVIEEEEEEGNEAREASQQSSEGPVTTTTMIRRTSILENVKINVANETPISKLKRLLVQACSSSVFTKDQLRKSEELMVQAFVEFYQKLGLLKSYRFMNRLAFSKIMKKYDKITKSNSSKSYLEMVDRSNLGSCDKVSHSLF